MKGDEEILLDVLALTDAVWLPMRTWAQPAPANVYFARRDFARTGVPWRSGASGEAERKEAQRLLERMAARGLVLLFRPRGFKTLGARLTEEGERDARALCGLPGVDDAARRLAEIVRLTDEMRRPWISEPALAGVAWGSPGAGKVLARLEDELLPALVRGWVESGADLHRRVYYRATPAGREAAGGAEASEGEQAPPARRSYGCEAYGLYLERLDAAQARLGTAKPLDSREIGFLPLSASMGGEAVYLADLAPREPEGTQAAGKASARDPRDPEKAPERAKGGRP